VNDDDRLHRYLSDRAEGIPLTPGDPSDVMRRGSRRRTRRRGALVGGVAIVGLLATTVVIQRGNDDQSVQLKGTPTATPSTYDWSVVNPGTGLGYSRSEAELAGGSIYGLSTAPGPANDKTINTPARLYRSDDGTEWVKAELPSGLSATSLAASGDTLYALGTAPAGGGARDLVVAASTDGAESWTSVKLPREVADLETRHPGQISLSAPTMAAKDATHQVVTIVVSANLDPTQLKPELAGKDYGWEWTDTGLSVYQVNTCKAIVPPATTDPTVAVTSTTGTAGANPKTADANTAAADGSPKSAIAEAQGCRTDATTVTTDANGNGPVVATYTWSDLGVDSELAGLVNGHTYSWVTDDGSHFTPVDLPQQGHGWGSSLVAGADGYTLFLGRSEPKAKSSTTEVLHSTDGHSWDTVTSLSGSPMSAGLLSGRPAVSLSGSDGQTSVQAQQADGSWLPVNLSAAVPQAAGVQSWVGEVAFGPLGLAATVSSFSERDKGVTSSWVVHSTDGKSLSILSIKDKVASSSPSPLGITVSADAITVRLSNGPATPGHPATQTVLVGTPAG
jgi:hypothetical protein